VRCGCGLVAAAGRLYYSGRAVWPWNLSPDGRWGDPRRNSRSFRRLYVPEDIN
jgi:hypothetical protein